MYPKDRLTRFEMARLVAARALQIELGAPCFVNVKGDSIKKAKEEIKRKIVPLVVKRVLPNGEEIEVDMEKAIDNWLKEHGDI